MEQECAVAAPAQGYIHTSIVELRSPWYDRAARPEPELPNPEADPRSQPRSPSPTMLFASDVTM